MMNFLNNLYGVSISKQWLADNPNYAWLGSLVSGINWALYPIMIIALAAGTIYSILLGVNLARAETSDKRDEAKKRLIWCIIGIVTIFILILVIELVVRNLPSLIG